VFYNSGVVFSVQAQLSGPVAIASKRLPVSLITHTTHGLALRALRKIRKPSQLVKQSTGKVFNLVVRLPNFTHWLSFARRSKADKVPNVLKPEVLRRPSVHELSQSIVSHPQIHGGVRGGRPIGLLGRVFVVGNI